MFAEAVILKRFSKSDTYIVCISHYLHIYS